MTQKRYTSEELIMMVQELARALGRSPTHKEWEECRQTPSIAPVRDRFGTWNNFLRAAGLPFNNYFWSKDLDPLLFKRIDSTPEAYWLGFLFGDGCTEFGRFGFKSKDKEHVYKFKKFLGWKGKIKTIVDLRSGKHYWEISIAKKEIVRNLREWGIKKGLRKIEKGVPSEFASHFVRGFFDADGYLGKEKISFCNDSQELKNQILRILEDDLGPLHPIKSKDQLVFKRKIEREEILDFMATDLKPEICLRRKWIWLRTDL